ncbi:hypothetical protein ACFL45_05465 [Candidatus Neomarinimicrobiota bacterium]
MKNLFLLLFCTTAALTAQSITKVDFEVLPGNLIEVMYSIYDTEPDAVYSIDLYASIDGGYTFPIHAQSVTGDVGSRIMGAGRKSIIWKVLDDVPALVSDNLAVKVAGRARPSVGGIFRSLLAGNRLTKRLSNGVTFYGGGGQYYILESSQFKSEMETGGLESKVNTRFGLRITSVPFVYRFNFIYRNWDLGLVSADEERLKYLSFADQSYHGEDLLLYYAGVSFSFAYTPLPILGIFLPAVGGGFSYNQFRLGSTKGSLTSSLNNPGLFAEVGFQINVTRGIKLNLGARQNFLSPQVNFTDTFIEFGLNIPTQ